jgi:hypothetical protein
MTMPANQSLPGSVSALVGLSLLAALASGCTQEPHCPELSSCGGPLPLGVYELVPGSESCSEDLFAPTIDTRLKDSEVPAARTPPVEPTFFDWCNLLVASGGEDILRNTPQFYYESGRIGSATIRYNPDGTFSAGLTRTGTFTLDFPAVCMRAFAATDGRLLDPDMPELGTGNVCKQLEGPLRTSGLNEGSYRNTTCDPNPADPQGCLCRFDVTETGGPAGVYQQLDASTILHLSNGSLPSKVTYCNTGNDLELTGANGAYLYNNGVGLRTLKLRLVSPPM